MSSKDRGRFWFCLARVNKALEFKEYKARMDLQEKRCSVQSWGCVARVARSTHRDQFLPCFIVWWKDLICCVTCWTWTGFPQIHSDYHFIFMNFRVTSDFQDRWAPRYCHIQLYNYKTILYYYIFSFTLSVCVCVCVLKGATGNQGIQGATGLRVQPLPFHSPHTVYTCDIRVWCTIAGCVIYHHRVWHTIAGWLACP